MATKYVNFGVTSGIGLADGSDKNNYMGWSEFIADSKDGNTYFAKGIGVLTSNLNPTVITITSWDDVDFVEPWGIVCNGYNFLNGTYGGYILKNGIILGLKNDIAQCYNLKNMFISADGNLRRIELNTYAVGVTLINGAYFSLFNSSEKTISKCLIHNNSYAWAVYPSYNLYVKDTKVNLSSFGDCKYNQGIYELGIVHDNGIIYNWEMPSVNLTSSSPWIDFSLGENNYGVGLTWARDHSKDSWNKERYGIGDFYFGDIELNNAIFAAGNSGIFRSVDYGESWKKVCTSAADLITYAGDGVVLAVTSAGSSSATLLKSIDYGESWVSLGVPSNYWQYVSDIKTVYNGEVVVVCYSLSVGFRGYILYSNDYGENWSAVSSGTSTNPFSHINHIGNGIVLALGNQYKRSTDYGYTWDDINIPVPSASSAIPGSYSYNTVLITDTIDGNTILGAGYVGYKQINTYNDVLSPTFYKSIDAGKTWESQCIDTVIGQSINSLIIFNNSLAYAVSNTGHIYKSLDNGTTWIFTGEVSANFGNFRRIDSTQALSTGSILKTYDTGDSWEIIDDSTGTVKFSEWLSFFKDVGLGHIGAFYFGPVEETVSADVIEISAIFLQPDVTVVNAVSATVTPFYIPVYVILLKPTVFATQDIKVNFVGVPRAGSSPLVVDFTAFVELGEGLKNRYVVDEYLWCFDYDEVNGICRIPWETSKTNKISHVYTGYRGQRYTVKVCVRLKLI